MLHKFLILLLLGSINLVAEDTATDSYVSSAYLLSPVDMLMVSVYGQADLSSQQRISDAGTVSIPLLGETTIGGLTVSAAQKKIEADFISEQFLVRPIVTISIIEFSPKVVTVLGEVERPGSIKIPAGRNSLSVQVAIAEAGGFTGAAQKSEVQIQRASTISQLESPETLIVNVSELLQASDSPKKLTLAGPDDIIFVPRRLF